VLPSPTAAARYQSVRDALGAQPSAENFRIRAATVAGLAAHIEQAGLPQAQAARQSGVTQPRISDLSSASPASGPPRPRAHRPEFQCGSANRRS